MITPTISPTPIIISGSMIEAATGSTRRPRPRRSPRPSRASSRALGLLTDLDHVRDHWREDRARTAASDGTPSCTRARTSASASSTTQLPDVWPVISSALMMSTPAAISGERAREARQGHLEDYLADLHRDLELDRSQTPRLAPCASPSGSRSRQRRGSGRRCRSCRAGSPENLDDPGSEWSIVAELREDVHEDGDEEHQHPDQDEGREDRDHRRVDHRALHAPLDLRLLLDLKATRSSTWSEDSRGLPSLDHRDVEPAEDLRVAPQCLESRRPPSTSARSSLTIVVAGTCPRSAPRG